MHHRRSTVTALVAVLLPLAAALTSCDSHPTDRVNTIAAGVNDRDGQVDVLGVRVVAWSDGQGRLIGSLVYNDNAAGDPVKLSGVTGAHITKAEVQGVEIVPARTINLASDDVAPVALTGDFKPGDVITLTFAFSNQESATLNVPVVKPCGQYAEISQPEFAPAAAEETDTPTEGESAAADESYLCEHPTQAAEGEEEGGH